MRKYLGMNLDYHGQGKVKIDMTDYLKKILDDLPESQQDNAEVKQEGRPGVPHHRGKTAFPVQAGPAGHPYRGGFPYDASKRDIRRRRQQIIADTKIYQRYKGYPTHHEIRQHQNSEMVGGRGIFGTPQHEEPHGRDDVNETRRPILRAEQAKN